jgi:Uma2 family endonuclease
MASGAKFPFLTVEQFLDLESAVDGGYRSEYENGNVVPIESSSANHSAITLNLAAMFHNKLRGQRCRAYSQNMLVQAGSQMYYPDLFVVCGEAKLRRTTVIENPSLIIEVLSPSTERRDRGVRFHSFQLIPSFSEYLLVSSDTLLVEQFIRQGRNDWQLLSHRDPLLPIPLSSLPGIAVELPDLYERVEWN